MGVGQGRVTHGWVRQWAAVNTHCRCTRTPPHRWEPDFCSETMYGCELGAASRPPMMWVSNVLPPGDGERKSQVRAGCPTPAMTLQLQLCSPGWNVLELDDGVGCTALNALKFSELYPLNGRIVQYVNDISIKLL